MSVCVRERQRKKEREIKRKKRHNNLECEKLLQSFEGNAAMYETP